MKNLRKNTLFVLLFSVFTISTFLSCKGPDPDPFPKIDWLDPTLPSIKDVYEGKLDYVGIAVQWGWPKPEYSTTPIQNGVKRHFNSVTMGNEMKPDEFLGTYTIREPSSTESFTDSQGKTIDVPKNHLQFGTVDQCLQASKNIGVKMRGHVLVWYSQTPDWFFKEGYKSSGKLVDKETMTARQEWYIKSVLEHVKNWENQNNNGERIIWAWDVVNEAASDTGTKLRNAAEGCNWYAIYNNDEFIVNAFRFANKYAPKDVLLAYNDYSEYNPNKRSMILNILDSVIAHENDAELPTRIDVMGMQSHLKYGDPTMDLYEESIQAYLAKGLDIHITELDIGAKTKSDANNNTKLKQAYKDCFEMYLRNAKTDNKNGITSVTIWGINDGSTWLNTDSQQPWLNYVKPQHPLLFNDDYSVKPAFFGVIEAAQ